MADNTCHFGLNLFFADNGVEEHGKSPLYFPGEKNPYAMNIPAGCEGYSQEFPDDSVSVTGDRLRDPLASTPRDSIQCKLNLVSRRRP